MPVYKYRDVSEMEDRSWYEPGDPRLFLAIRATWELAQRTTRPRFPPGVYKHRSIVMAEKLREQWERSNFEAHHTARSRKRRADESC
jgi:hypothetical protein